MTSADLAQVAAVQASSREAAEWKVDDYLFQESWVLEVDGVILGFAVSRAVVPALEYELLNMAITPNARGIGHGRTLLWKLLAEYRGLWFLEVRESNTPARKLYETAGFQVTRRRKNYYCDPPEDAIEMSNHS
jgi:[ribosomal protein S18]-alanine N-acetyltransferase